MLLWQVLLQQVLLKQNQSISNIRIETRRYAKVALVQLIRQNPEIILDTRCCFNGIFRVDRVIHDRTVVLQPSQVWSMVGLINCKHTNSWYFFNGFVKRCHIAGPVQLNYRYFFSGKWHRAITHLNDNFWLVVCCHFLFSH